MYGKVPDEQRNTDTNGLSLQEEELIAQSWVSVQANDGS